MVLRTVDLLIVEDSESDAMLLEQSLTAFATNPPTLQVSGTLNQAIKSLRQTHFSAVLLDLNLPDSFGIDTFRDLKQQAKTTPILILSGTDDVDLATTAVREGAQDYVLKGEYHTKTLVRAISFAIERGRRIAIERELSTAEGELQAAQDVQEWMLPRQAPDVDGFDIAGASFSAAKACGDYFDFIQYPDGRHAIVVADVSGHGLRAALLMVDARSCLRTMANLTEDLSQTLQAIDRRIAEDAKPGQFATMCVIRLDPRSGALEYVGAGQLSYVIRADGSVDELAPTNCVLGMGIGEEFKPSGGYALERGDLLLVPTDGFQEAMTSDRTLFGVPRMLDTVRSSRNKSAAEIIEDLHLAVGEFFEGPQQDGMTVAIAKRFD